MKLRAVGSFLKSYADSYLYVLTVLVLNVPVISLVLLRDLRGAEMAKLTWGYVACVFLGYYALILLALVTLTFVTSLLIRRVAIVTSGVILSLAVYYLILDSVVYDIYKFHVDMFWLEYLFTDYKGLGIPLSLLLTAILIFVVVAGLEVSLFHWARRIRLRGTVAAVFVAAAVLGFAVSQSVHIMAYYNNDNRITSITPRLPLYYPIVSHKHAVQYEDKLPPVLEPDEADAYKYASLRYPLKAPRCVLPAGRKPLNLLVLMLESWRFDMMDSLVSPHMEAFSHRSSVFLRHFSSGNSTPSGVFGLFYGIEPTYWTAVKANSAAIDNPVLIDALEANGYALGIYADSHFERHKIKDTTFNGIEVHETFAGATTDEKDADLNRQLVAFMGEQKRLGRPFMGYAFYKSTHHSYYYPRDEAVFTPAKKMNLALVGSGRDPVGFLNDYRNAVHYVDRLFGELMADVDSLGLADNTVVVLTSDHSEEFNDNHANYWGHGSNFTKFQTQVPMIIYVPGRAPRRVTETTMHVDIPPTLIHLLFESTQDVRDYSNGVDLFGPIPKERPVVVTSYFNHAFILDDDVYAVYPLFTQKYRLDDINAHAGRPRAELLKAAMDEINRFYSTAGPKAPVAKAATMAGTRLARPGSQVRTTSTK